LIFSINPIITLFAFITLFICHSIAFVNLDIFMSRISSCVNDGYLICTNNKYYINHNSIKYKNYIKNERINNENFSQILESLNFLEISNETDENDSSEQFNECYIIESQTSYDYHLVNVELTTCSCKSYEFCKLPIKTCKHLDLVRSYDSTQLAIKYPIFNTTQKKCSCIEFQNNNDCIHYTNLKQYGY
jgi:hypothetical protein